ncbi:hypothetical protein [Tepidibacillus marianensis]|uniref:hypothetical protein n=1 Tax=Tepidibacillus marianensis TaxID=3131995 RepID=UPI0030CB339A
MGANRQFDYYNIAVISAIFMIGIGGIRPLISLILANKLHATTWQIGMIHLGLYWEDFFLTILVIFEPISS